MKFNSPHDQRPGRRFSAIRRQAVVPVIVILVIAAATRLAAQWLDSGQQGRKRAPLASGHVSVVAEGLVRPGAIAAAGDRILYVAQTDADGGGSVVRIDLGTGGLTLLQKGPAAVGAIAVDAAEGLYWTSPSAGTLSYVASTGDSPQDLRSGLQQPGGMAVGGAGQVYFTEQPVSNPGGDVKGLSVLDETGMRVLYSGGATPTGVAAGIAGDLYWTSRQEGLIYHLGPDGAGETLLTGLDRPSAIALDEASGTLYFAEAAPSGTGADQGGWYILSALSLSSRTKTVFFRGDSEPGGITVAANGAVYWTSARQGLVFRLIPPGKSSDEEGGHGMSFRARLSGSEETPPVTTTATGQATFTLKSSMRVSGDPGEKSVMLGGQSPSLQYSVETQNLLSVQAAQIRDGAPGQNGPLVALLNVSSSGIRQESVKAGVPQAANGHFETRGSLTPADLGVGSFAGNWDGFTRALAGGQLYLTILTAAHPEGEIRGQILGRSGRENHPPEGAITSPRGEVSIAAGQSVPFTGTATDPDGDMVTVRWDFGDGATSTALSPGDHVYMFAGTYRVTLTATDSRGLSDPEPPHRTVTVTGGSGPVPTPTPRPTMTATPARTPTEPPEPEPTHSPTRTPTPRPTMTATPARTPTSPPGPTPTPTPRPTMTATPVRTPTSPPGPTPTSTPTPNPTPTSAPASTLTSLQTGIFTPRCAGCHAGTSPPAGLNLSNGQSFANLVNVPATTRSGIRVVPGSPSTSALLAQLASGHGGATTAQQAQISSWISAGALNN